LESRGGGTREKQGKGLREWEYRGRGNFRNTWEECEGSIVGLIVLSRGSGLITTDHNMAEGTRKKKKKRGTGGKVVELIRRRGEGNVK